MSQGPTIGFNLNDLPMDIKGESESPHISPLTKEIPLKLFLDIVPSSSEDVTRAMRGQQSDFL